MLCIGGGLSSFLKRLGLEIRLLQGARETSRDRYRPIRCRLFARRDFSRAHAPDVAEDVAEGAVTFASGLNAMSVRDVDAAREQIAVRRQAEGLL